MPSNSFYNESDTSKVRILCEQLLSDCEPHTRREMEEYIISNFSLLGLARPTHGCLSGGIRNAIQNKNCTKLGTALYQAPAESSAQETAPSRILRASECIEAAISTISSIAHEIDFIEANAAETDELTKLKACILSLKTAHSDLNA